jgi:hypothetical protein
VSRRVQSQRSPAGLGQARRCPGRLPSQVDDDVTDPVDRQEPLADAAIDAASPTGDEEVMDRSSPVQHGHHDMSRGVPPPHVVHQPEVHDIRIRGVELFVRTWRSARQIAVFTDGISPASPGRANAPILIGASATPLLAAVAVFGLVQLRATRGTASCSESEGLGVHLE